MERELRPIIHFAPDLFSSGDARMMGSAVEILQEILMDPGSSAINVEAADFSISLTPPEGFRALWLVFHNQYFLTVAETGSGKRVILEVLAYAKPGRHTLKPHVDTAALPSEEIKKFLSVSLKAQSTSRVPENDIESSLSELNTKAVDARARLDDANEYLKDVIAQIEKRHSGRVRL